MKMRSMLCHLLVVVVAACTLVGCGFSTGSMTASELAASLKAGMQADSDYNGVKIGEVSCDNGVRNVGDMALCKAHLDDGTTDSGVFQFNITLKDSQGHFEYELDHKIK